MDLYETDKTALIAFLKNNHGSDLILYNFAADLKYAKDIQSDLFIDLLPFYFNAIENAIINESSKYIQITNQFNDALFFNQNTIIKCISSLKFDRIMSVYQGNLYKKISTEDLGKTNWIPWFNTFLAFEERNIKSFFKNFNLNLNIKAQSSFFLYVSCFLFQKKDSLFITKVEQLYVTPILWDFQSEISNGIYWNMKIRKVFYENLTLDFIKSLFVRVKSFLSDFFNEEDLFFVENELDSEDSLVVLDDRINEYLQKMMKENESQYWLDAF